MTTVQAQRAATRRWRQRVRKLGRSWNCILARHEMCSGRRGRLKEDQTERRSCTCLCHTTPDVWADEP